MKRQLLLLGLSAAALLSGGALLTEEPKSVPPPVDGKHVLIVGRIEVQPAISAEELEWGKVGPRDANLLTLRTGEKRVFGELPSGDDVDDELKVRLGEWFFEKVKRRTFYVYNGTLLMSTHFEGEDAYALLPGSLRVEIKPDDTAVYIGSLQYFRDEFFGITKIYIHDEYDQAVAAFEKKYGKGNTLRKSLVIPPRDMRR